MIIFKKIAAPGKYQDDMAIHDVVNYICRKDKALSGIIGGVQIDKKNIDGSMTAVSERFGKNSRVRLHHFVVSFGPTNPGLFQRIPLIADRICFYIGMNYQIVYAVHEDTQNLHIHFVFNAVSYCDGRKYRGGVKEYHQLIYLVENVLSDFGLSPLIPVKYVPDSNNPHE